MLGLREPDITSNLMKQLEGEFMPIACNKYGSNVVEKFMESGEEYSTRIIMELVGDSNASMILLDPFGNYVIQSALAVSKVSSLLESSCFLAIVISALLFLYQSLVIISELVRWTT